MYIIHCGRATAELEEYLQNLVCIFHRCHISDYCSISYVFAWRSNYRRQHTFVRWLEIIFERRYLLSKHETYSSEAQNSFEIALYIKVLSNFRSSFYFLFDCFRKWNHQQWDTTAQQSWSFLSLEFYSCTSQHLLRLLVYPGSCNNFICNLFSRLTTYNNDLEVVLTIWTLT